MVRERLQKVLSQAGVASRRRAEELIVSGEVTVDGRTAGLGDSADPAENDIRVSGVPLTVPRSHQYLALNKPTGYVSSLRSTHGERTVMDLIPGERRLFPVGRLDKDTSGLLLMTDDGDWSNHVTHPRYGIEKEYDVLVLGRPSASELDRLRAGVALPGGTLTAPAVRVVPIGDDGENARLAITVVEGKKRQIRLMMAAIGHPVLSLRRVRIGDVRLGSRPQGTWWTLSQQEVNGLRDLAERNARRGSSRPQTSH